MSGMMKNERMCCYQLEWGPEVDNSMYQKKASDLVTGLLLYLGRPQEQLCGKSIFVSLPNSGHDCSHLSMNDLKIKSQCKHMDQRTNNPLVLCPTEIKSVQTSVFTPLTQYFIKAGLFVLFGIYSPSIDILSFLSADLLSLIGGSNHYWTFPFRVFPKPPLHLLLCA